MNFEEWHEHQYRNLKGCFKSELEEAWNAAIDEAVKVVESGRDSQLKSLLTVKIKELKE